LSYPFTFVRLGHCRVGLLTLLLALLIRAQLSFTFKGHQTRKMYFYTVRSRCQSALLTPQNDLSRVALQWPRPVLLLIAPCLPLQLCLPNPDARQLSTIAPFPPRKARFSLPPLPPDSTTLHATPSNCSWNLSVLSIQLSRHLARSNTPIRNCLIPKCQSSPPARSSGRV